MVSFDFIWCLRIVFMLLCVIACYFVTCQRILVLMFSVRCSMCILRIYVICNLCNVTAILTVIK